MAPRLHQLATAQPASIAGGLCARSEAHTIRLALLYALADGKPKIKTEHLESALALWDYTARSATWALKGATGDPLAEQIHAALRHHPAGLTRSQISDILHTTGQPTKSSKRSAPSNSPAARPTPSSPPADAPPTSGPRQRRQPDRLPPRT